LRRGALARAKGVYKQQTAEARDRPKEARERHDRTGRLGSNAFHTQGANLMRECEIIYVKSKSDGTVGWKWRLVEDKSRASEETYELFYECVTAARAKGLQPNVKCP
jgi:hypothetical protein